MTVSITNVGTYHFITARKRSLGQGNIFAPVCHSVHRGEYLTPPGSRHTSQDQVHPPGSRHPLGPGKPPRADPPRTRYTPQSRHPQEQTPPAPGPDTPLDQVHPHIPTPSLAADTPHPRADTPPPHTHTHREHAGRYGQHTGGTHPTGMQSCCRLLLSIVTREKVATLFPLEMFQCRDKYGKWFLDEKTKKYSGCLVGLIEVPFGLCPNFPIC